MASDNVKKPGSKDSSGVGHHRSHSHKAAKRKSSTVLGMKLKSSASALGIKLNLKKDTTLECRYELKYRIHEAKARAVAEYVKSYLHLDRYAKLRPRGEYPIVSLYLDSDNFRLARETLEGKKNRFKLRVRGYSENAETPCFFEIKRRISNVIMKSRARVKYNDVARIIRDGHFPTDYKTDEKALKQFILYMNYIKARPMVLIRYMREAYEGDSDNRVRVTFDRKICYNVTRKPVLRLNNSGWQRSPAHFVVLEIKFTAKYPAWLGKMVKLFNLKQSAMSKYATSIKASCDLGFCAPQGYAFGAPQLSGYLDG
jgi:hypothetical protein